MSNFGYRVLGFGAGGRTITPFVNATGGNTTITDGNFKIHVFTGDGTLAVANEGTPAGSNTVEYFVVAGGGPGGGKYRGAGAGGGGWRTNYPSPATGGLAIAFQSYPVQVGAGGGTSPSPRHSAATPSIFSTITSTRGGGHAQPGGSGGGNNGTSGNGTGNAGGFSPPEGNPGGNSTGGCSPGAGGGGGANSSGTNG